MIVSLEPGITPKKALYNYLHQLGYFLPAYTSNCITQESLNNMRSGKYVCYFNDELAKEINSNCVLLAPVETAYRYLQCFHFTKHGKVLPFKSVPTEEYIKIIVKHVDPDNTMNFLKSEYMDIYDHDIILSDGQLIRHERPQGQAIQRIVDQELNNAMRLYHSIVAHSIRAKELMNEFAEIKISFTADDVQQLDDDEKALYIAAHPENFVDNKVAYILSLRATEAAKIKVIEELPSSSRILEESDGGENIDDSEVSNEEEKLAAAVKKRKAMRRAASVDAASTENVVIGATGRRVIATAFRPPGQRFLEEEQSVITGNHQSGKTTTTRDPRVE